MAMDVVGMIVVVKAADVKNFIRSRNSQIKQIGVEEDAVEEEAAGQTIPTLSATSATSMVTMQRIAPP